MCNSINQHTQDFGEIVVTEGQQRECFSFDVSHQRFS